VEESTLATWDGDGLTVSTVRGVDVELEMDIDAVDEWDIDA